jgi:putative (di)nucleoside polyphosphate hydrolase
MYRELEEETGLLREHVKILGRTKGWLHYHVPTHWIKREWRGTYKGQKQIWYLLRLTGRDHDIRLRASTHPEFDAWRWHDYWVPLENVIEFKRDVYQQALQQLVRFLDHAPRGQFAANRRFARHETPVDDAGPGLIDSPEAGIDLPEGIGGMGPEPASRILAGTMSTETDQEPRGELPATQAG